MRHRIRQLRMLIDALGLIEKQNILVDAQNAEIDRLKQELVDLELSYARIIRDRTSQFLVVLDKPEIQPQIRNVLFDGLRDLNDHVARLEEQTR